MANANHSKQRLTNHLRNVANARKVCGVRWGKKINLPPGMEQEDATSDDGGKRDFMLALGLLAPVDYAGKVALAGIFSIVAGWMLLRMD
jgi:hypothetical protein